MISSSDISWTAPNPKTKLGTMILVTADRQRGTAHNHKLHNLSLCPGVKCKALRPGHIIYSTPFPIAHQSKVQILKMIDLLRLPNELLFLIAKDLDLPNLYSLVRTNRRFATVLTPLLHRVAAKSGLCLIGVCWAAASRNEPLLRVLLERGTSMVIKGEVGISIKGNEGALLHRVPGKCDDAAINRVMEKGANIVVRQKRGRHKTWEGPALHWAARAGYEALAILLLDNGAEVNATDPHGWTALHHAAAMFHEGMVRLLLERGADRFIRGKNSDVPLDRAKDRIGGFSSETWRSMGKVVMLLLADTDVNFEYKGGMKPIHLVASYSEDDVTELGSLLEKGASITDRDYSGSTALHLAAGRGNEKIVRLLVEKGTDLYVDSAPTSTRNSHVRSPITLANPFAGFLVSRSSKLATHRFLLEKAPLSFLTDIHDYHDKMVSPLHLAAVYHDEELVRLLLKRGFEVDAKDPYGETPLHRTVRKNPNSEVAIAIIKLLLEHGANINSMNISRCTPLHSAVEVHKTLDREAVVRLLLDKGCNVNPQDQWGRTPLHDAVYAGHEKMIQLLLGKGANASIMDYAGRTIYANREARDMMTRLSERRRSYS